MGCGIGDPFVAAYATQAPAFAATLVLSNNHVSDAGVAALCAAPRGTLRHLGLAYNCITTEGALALAALLHEAHPHAHHRCEGSSPRGLDHLNLEGNHIDNSGARAIAQAAAGGGAGAVSVNLSYVSSEAPELSVWAAALAAGRLQSLELAQLMTHNVEVRFMPC